MTSVSGADISGAYYHINDIEAAWNTGTVYPEGNKGHRPRVKGRLLPLPPVDSSQGSAF